MIKLIEQNCNIHKTKNNFGVNKKIAKLYNIPPCINSLIKKNIKI